MKILNAGDSLPLFNTDGAPDSAQTHIYGTIKVNPGCKLSIVAAFRSDDGSATFPDGIAYLDCSVDNVYWTPLAEINLQELTNSQSANIEDGQIVFWSTSTTPLNLSTNYIRISPLTQQNAGVGVHFAIKIGG